MYFNSCYHILYQIHYCKSNFKKVQKAEIWKAKIMLKYHRKPVICKSLIGQPVSGVKNKLTRKFKPRNKILFETNLHAIFLASSRESASLDSVRTQAISKILPDYSCESVINMTLLDIYSVVFGASSSEFG